MRITNVAELKKLVSDGRLGAGASAQIKNALTEAEAQAKKKAVAQKPARKASGGQSVGEAAVAVALRHTFGDWFDGGEVVPEFKPFANAGYRADFALPRYRISVEIEGWQHHGRSLDDHHADRKRGMYFARYNWLVFRISHRQAIKETGDLLDAIAGAMSLREPCDRQLLSIGKKELPSGIHTHLQSGHPDLLSS